MGDERINEKLPFLLGTVQSSGPCAPAALALYWPKSYGSGGFLAGQTAFFPALPFCWLLAGVSRSIGAGAIG